MDDDEQSSAEMLTKSELAAVWGVTPQAVHDMFSRAGAPGFVGGKISRIVAENWRNSRKRLRVSSMVSSQKPGLDIAEARRQQEIIKAMKMRMDYDRARGELIPRAEVEANCREDGARIRAALMAMPARIAPTLADAAASGGIPAVAAALEADVRRTLEALASLESLDMDGGENGTQATQ